MAEAFERVCLEVGRVPSTVKRSWCGGCICAPSQSQAESIAAGLYSADNTGEDFDFVGTPRLVIEQMRAFIDLGVDYFMLDCGGFPELTTLELLIREVLPILNGR
jgi:alkanesulfonate monooxygenase SsuD/methylene tetrahydromethanopterin reductase-like flavin-dependent oxidoreductase (luciferase family)